MNNLAASLTDHVLNLGNESVSGSVKANEIYVLDRWEWLISPMVLESTGLPILI